MRLSAAAERWHEMLAPRVHNPVCAIGVMAKAPQAGRSKTRLCPPLLPEQAAMLSAAFLRDTFENLELAARAAPIAAYAAYAPIGTEAMLRGVIGSGPKLLLADGAQPVPQGVEGLGRCLLQAIETMLAEGHAAACVLSSDCPTLPTQLLAQAAGYLLAPGDRGVFGATNDGGYYLLGLKAAHAHLFRDIAWSTDRVAVQTRERARDIGLALVELEMWYDIDDAASLAELLSIGGGYAAPHTNAALDRLELRHLSEPQTAAGSPI